MRLRRWRKPEINQLERSSYRPGVELEKLNLVPCIGAVAGTRNALAAPGMVESAWGWDLRQRDVLEQRGDPIDKSVTPGHHIPPAGADQYLHPQPLGLTAGA
jgi:hypothetical protein